MMDVQLLSEINKGYSDPNIHLLRKLNEKWAKEKPLKNISILHNLILSYETLQKIESLLWAGANLTVTNCDLIRVPFIQEIENILEKCQIRYIPRYQDIRGDFDIGMDCGGRIPAIPNARILKGTVELTQTGTVVYRKLRPSYPVISVDDSHLKNFECLYGTGEAFIRAFESLSGKNISGKRFMIFGFGKIGRGIHHHLQLRKAKTVFVDSDRQTVYFANQEGIHTYHSSQKAEIQEEVKNAFAVVTATGANDLLQSYFGTEDLFHCYLANMGVEDEISEEFLKLPKLLFQGNAINFSLKDPTLMKFLDPVFYAHNLAAEVLVKEELAPGYHPFDLNMDLSVIREWENAYQEKMTCILPNAFQSDLAS